jgi:hypothetical protein
MTRAIPTTFSEPAISVDIPPGAGRTYCAARIAAVLRGERPRKPRKVTLTAALKQAARAGTAVKGAEIYHDRVVLQFGEPAPADADNAWPLDEFRTKETKQ